MVSNRAASKGVWLWPTGVRKAGVAVDRMRRSWIGDLDAHIRAVHAHEAAAAFFDRMGDATRAAIESQRAATERRAYARAAAQHPEWSADVSFGLMRRHDRGVRGAIDGS